MLESLHRQHLFTTPADGPDGWFRYHPLFRTLLRHHLADEDPEADAELLARAGRWYLDRGDLDAGVAAYAEAGAWADVLAAVTANGARLRIAGRSAAAARWIGLVPSDHRPDATGTALLEAACWAVAGDGGARLHGIGQLEAAETWGPGHQLAAALVATCALVVVGRPDEAVEAADRATRLLDRVGGDVADADLPHLLGLTNTVAHVRAGVEVLRGVALVRRRSLAEGIAVLDATPDDLPTVWKVAAHAARALALAVVRPPRRGRAGGPMGVEAVVGPRRRGRARLGRRPARPGRGVTRTGRARRSPGPHRPRPPPHLGWARPPHVGGAGDAGGTAGSSRRARPPLASPSSSPAAGAGRGEGPELPAGAVVWQRAAETSLYLASGDVGAAGRSLELAPVETVEVAAARVALALDIGDTATATATLANWPAGPTPTAPATRRLWASILRHREGDPRVARRPRPSSSPTPRARATSACSAPTTSSARRGRSTGSHPRRSCGPSWSNRWPAPPAGP